MVLVTEVMQGHLILNEPVKLLSMQDDDDSLH
jgi:hypothetical protein